jgi:hypothetical protein
LKNPSLSALHSSGHVRASVRATTTCLPWWWPLCIRACPGICNVNKHCYFRNWEAILIMRPVELIWFQTWAPCVGKKGALPMTGNFQKSVLGLASDYFPHYTIKNIYSSIRSKITFSWITLAWFTMWELLFIYFPDVGLHLVSGH